MPIHDDSTRPSAAQATGSTPPPDLNAEVAKAKAAAALWVATQSQIVGLRLRNLIFKLVLLATAALVGIIVLITATVQLMNGLAALINDLTDRPWPGPLVLGVLVLGATFTLLWLVPRMIRKSSARAMLETYGAPPPPTEDR